MKTGTKSLLFGVHQIFWHPVTVWLAWVWLNKSLPTWKECICIIIHDWGYWGKEHMDDEEGEKHPEIGALIAHCLLDDKKLKVWIEGYDKYGKTALTEKYYIETTYHDLCLLHSRHYARNLKREPSRLCWADKASILFDPWWLYLPRAWLSGELFEYRDIAANTGFVPLSKTHRQWFTWIKKRLSTLSKEKRGDVVPYANPKRSL
jgi:hypothetical protein